ncbi:M23 family metallopeptidase [Paraconexibacter sp.]|uniref:M23 family metallopeptidase n=1 Tax=Paraconexibacter sp. TaxID=2949640 RepID=UPI00356438A3
MRIGGEALDRVVAVVFLGGPGSDDDRGASVIEAAPGAVTAPVPDGASTGPILVINGDGNVSKPTKDALTISSGSELSSLGGGVEARVDSRRVFYAGRRQARVSYFVRGDGPVTVRGEIVRRSNGKVLRTFGSRTVPGGTVQSLEWNGTVAGRVPSDGGYLWRIHVQPRDSNASAQASQADGVPESVVEERFTFIRDRFPINGKHSYGKGAGAYGAARGHGRHQGQDVFARCGTPLVAARGGVVKFAGSHSRAGNYLVIDPSGTGQDHVYMHLKDKVTLRKGDRVFTGQAIGAVGDTGVADGCHLHFELWSSPGWYTGGHSISPVSALKRWDRFS